MIRIRVLNKVGFKAWETSIESGTSTKDCIIISQRCIDFLGVAATKWTAEKDDFRRMLVRHASNGGSSRFLLLNPFGNACSQFEAIKDRPAGSLRKTIIENAQLLVRLRNAKLPIDVRFYESEPHFRVVTVDDSQLLLGLYAYFNDDGRGGPQLIFDGKPRDWSFYNAFSAYFEKTWSNAESADVVLARRRNRRRGDAGASSGS